MTNKAVCLKLALTVSYFWNKKMHIDDNVVNLLAEFQKLL